MDTESDTGVSDVDSVVSSETTPLKPAFPPIKKEKLADGSEVGCQLETRKHFLNFRNIQGAEDPSSKPPLHSAKRELDEDLRANCGTSETSGLGLATLCTKASTMILFRCGST